MEQRKPEPKVEKGVGEGRRVIFSTSLESGVRVCSGASHAIDF